MELTTAVDELSEALLQLAAATARLQGVASQLFSAAQQLTAAVKPVRRGRALHRHGCCKRAAQRSVTFYTSRRAKLSRQKPRWWNG